MNVVDILVTIIVVTILVTIVLAVVTYIAYKLRLARRPTPAGNGEGPRFFDVHRPPEEEETAWTEGAREAPEPQVAALSGGAQPAPGRPEPATAASEPAGAAEGSEPEEEAVVSVVGGGTERSPGA